MDVLRSGRKLRCDGRQPQCGTCYERDEACSWDDAPRTRISRFASAKSKARGISPNSFGYSLHGSGNLNSIDPETPSSWEVLRILTKGSRVKDFTGLVDRDERQYIGGGNFGDVYRGVWSSKAAEQGERPEVVVKVLRSMGNANRKKRLKVITSLLSDILYVLNNTVERLRRELRVWQTLDHENIVPFVGMVLISDILPSLVSIWMPKGIHLSFLRRTTSVKN